MAAGVVLWDFDGTLALRPGMWSGCLIEVLDEHSPGHSGDRETVRAAIRGGFPWDRHHEPHPLLSDPDAWWEAVTPLLSEAIGRCGVEAGRERELAHAVRLRYTDGSRGWQLYDDTRPALARTAAAGWRNVILSNHVPELAALVSALGLDDLVEEVFTSATTGYEKPHPEAFRIALTAFGNPARRWMVGDNPVADVGGAHALGIPAILIRTDEGAPDAMAAAELITAPTQDA